MASPQRENGCIDIANELAEALARIRISGEEWQVLWVILRKTWGWKVHPKDKKSHEKKKMDAISLSQFVEMTGISKPHICRALKNLLTKRIIIKKENTIANNGNGIANNGNGPIVMYGPQKDYEKWQPLPKKVTIAKKGNLPIAKKGTHKRNTSLPRPTLPLIQKKKNNIYMKSFQFIQWWNNLAEEPNLPKCRKGDATKYRDFHNKILRRLREYPDKETWDQVEQKIRASPFLKGEKDWAGVSIEFLTRNVEKVAEIIGGKYDDKGKKKRHIKLWGE